MKHLLPGFVSLFALACGSSESGGPNTGGGSIVNGGGDGFAWGAGMDGKARQSDSAVAPNDGSGTKAEAEGHDGNAADVAAVLPDASTLDTVPEAFAYPCTFGEYESCTTSCGSVGMRYCSKDWGPCVAPAEECGGGVDDDCDGLTDESCSVVLQLDIDGDCVTASCPADAPYPIGCNIIMSGGDDRGCVASSPNNPVVYFQEGDKCGAGHVSGTLTCSSEPGTGLNETNCPINKSDKYYPQNKSGCPDASPW